MVASWWITSPPAIEARREKARAEGKPHVAGDAEGRDQVPGLRGLADEQDQDQGIEQQGSRAAGQQGSSVTVTYYRCWGTGSRPKGCGSMVRMEVADAAVNEIMATTFRVPVKRLILVKGSDHQDELEEIRYRMRDLDPDVITDDQ